MPVITVTLMEGYDEETRRGLSTRLTDAVHGAIAAPLDGITVVLNEVPAANYMRGGVSRIPGSPLPSPTRIVRDYLEAMEGRDMEKAKSILADGFTMTLPGGVTFSQPEELAAWARSRYRSISKSCERFDEAPCAEGVAVYCFGELAGEWPDGAAFSGVRFIDRFTVADGKLLDQRVWNDLAEARSPGNGFP